MRAGAVLLLILAAVPAGVARADDPPAPSSQAPPPAASATAPATPPAATTGTATTSTVPAPATPPPTTPAPSAPAPAPAPATAPATPPPPAEGKPNAAPAPPADPSAIPAELRPEVRIQRRYVEKQRRFALYAGFAYLGRGDFYTSPGVEAAVSFYPAEVFGLDLRGAWFFSSPTPEQLDIVRRTGLVPDSRPSKGSLLLGGRISLGYAKIKVSARRVLHFEPQLLLYGGVHFAGGPKSSTLAGPMGEIGLGFLIYAGRVVQVRLDAGVTLGGEQRTRYELVVGGYPALDVGVMF